MKLDKIYIDGFGKLKDFELDLSDGLNVFYGDNESGKTTIMAFIKMMFYGTGKNTSSILKSPRKRYEPFFADTFGGKIEFTNDGTKYRLERTFKGSNSADKVALWNLTTGEKEDVPSSNEVGSAVFGMSAAAFEQSVYIGSAAVGPADAVAAGEIGGKLANLVSSGDEEISFETVSARLASARFVYKSKSGHVGITDKLNTKINQLNEELSAARQRDELKLNMGIRAESLQKMITDLSRQLDEANDAVAAFEKFGRANEFKKIIAGYHRLEEEKEKLSELKNSVSKDGAEVTEEFLTEAEQSLSQINSAGAKIKMLEVNGENEETEKLNSLRTENQTDTERLELLNSQREQLMDKKAGLEGFISASKNKPIVALIIIGILLIIGGAAAGFMFNSVLYAVSLIGLICAVVGFAVRLPKKDKKQAVSDLEDAEADIAQKDTEISVLQDKISAGERLIESLTAATMREAEIQSAKEIIEEKTNELCSMLKPFGEAASPDEFSKLLKSLRENKAEYNKQKASVDAIEALVLNQGDLNSAVSGLEALGELPDENDPRITKIAEHRAATSRLNVKISEYKTNLSALQTEIRTSFVGKKTAAQIENEIKSAKADLAAQEGYCDALSEAYTVLRESYEEMMNSFGPALNSRTAEIFSSLSCGKYNNAIVSKDLSIAAEAEKGGLTDWQYLSAGTADQAYLALKLALTELICKGSAELPVMMDDPFVQYDSKRAAKAMEFLDGYSADRQVIMFTCRESVRKKANTLGARVIELNN